MHLASCAINTISRIPSRRCHRFAPRNMRMQREKKKETKNRPHILFRIRATWLSRVRFCTAVKLSRVYRNAIGIIAHRTWFLKGMTLGTPITQCGTRARARACNYYDAWVWITTRVRVPCVCEPLPLLTRGKGKREKEERSLIKSALEQDSLYRPFKVAWDSRI